MNMTDERIAHLEHEVHILKSQLNGGVQNNCLETLDANIPDITIFRFVSDVRTQQWRLSYVSETWEAITGIPASLATCDINTVFEMVHPDDLWELMGAMEKSGQALSKFHAEVRMINHRCTRWLQISSRPRREGEHIVADGVVLDITDRKILERELKSEKNRLQTLGDNIPGGTLFQLVRHSRTRQMRLSYVSATWQTVTGIATDVAIADITSFLTAIHPDDLPLFRKALDHSAQTMTDFNMEFRCGDRWLHIVSRPRYEDAFIIWNVCSHNHSRELNKLFRQNTRNDAFIVWEGIIINITERKNIENRLVESEKKYTLVSDYTKDMFWVIDARTLRYTFAGGACLGMYGYSNEEFLNMSLHDILSPQDIEAILKVIREKTEEYHEEGANHYFQYATQTFRKDGSPVWVEASMRIAPDENGELTQMVGFTRDIDERVKTEAEIAEFREKKTAELTIAKEKAEESDRLKSAFLANMSHEIRTPLNAIVGFLGFVDSENISCERRREYIKVVNNSCQQLAKIIDDIMDISKIEAQQLSVTPIPVQLNELMKELQVFFEAYLKARERRNIELVLDDSGFVNPCVINVDATRLRQVFNNLFDNAIKFTDKGYIRFGYRKLCPNYLEFAVEDTGIGLPPCQHEVIFERFRQAENGNNRLYGGTGLGLTISRSLVQLMGGDMWVESTEGAGASFYFTISHQPVG